ncbi:MAG: diphthine synthase, partial [Candidatus Diapherotrites archaeon]|nr:diphthine synthase [Candidatus Diapherotrites archaeon]
MLYIIGIGLKPEHITLEALRALEECEDIYLETYTSAFAEGDLKGLKKAVGGKKINLLDREQVEEEFAQNIMPNAKNEDVALLVFGAPLFATTHVQLLIDAKALKVKTRVVQGISVQNFLPETGLDAYKFGRIATIVAPEENYAPESFYEIIEGNFANGLHTLCLLDI